MLQLFASSDPYEVHGSASAPNTDGDATSQIDDDIDDSTIAAALSLASVQPLVEASLFTILVECLPTEAVKPVCDRLVFLGLAAPLLLSNYWDSAGDFWSDLRPVCDETWEQVVF